ncbi:hypothetical protein, partial [Stenotrophomonas geniculata]|uniref:hypothetical protein n=1 Tax=Stenotrophomonas geniculata TaxID=86188 RepID=UPI003BF84A5D
YMPEGDIHVWPDDHIEWGAVEDLLIQAGCKVVLKEDYLLFYQGYREEVYEAYKDRCTDVRLLVARRWV